MNNEEAKIHLQSAKLMLLGADGQPVSDLYYAVEKGIKALETIPKYKDAYGKGWIDGVNATNVDCGVVWEERIDAIKAEIQERQRTMMPVIPVQEVFEIIDKHCGGDNE